MIDLQLYQMYGFLISKNLEIETKLNFSKTYGTCTISNLCQFVNFTRFFGVIFVSEHSMSMVAYISDFFVVFFVCLF